VLTLEIYEKNTPIITFGEIGDRFYIILKGKVRVVVPTRALKRSNSTKKEIVEGIKRMNSIVQDEDDCSGFSEHERRVSSIIRGLQRQKTQLDFDYLTNFGVIEESKEVRILTDGDCFGELALINNKPRTATILAQGLVYLAVLSKKDYNRILATHTFKSLDERVEHLKMLPSFNLATKLSLQKLAYTFTEKSYKKDQVVYTKGDPTDTLYFIKSGEFKLSQCEMIETPKYSSSDVAVKLSLMRKLSRRVKLKEVIKGKNEIFGYEELVECRDSRVRKCICISPFCQIYEVKIEDMKRFPLFEEVSTFFQERYETEYVRHAISTEMLEKTPRSKLASLNTSKPEGEVHHMLYNMRKKKELFKINTLKANPSMSTLSSPVCEVQFKVTEAATPVVRPSHYIKQKNKLSQQFIQNALAERDPQPKVFHRRGLRKSTLETATARDELRRFGSIFSY
jgi:CRP-like cAMP-binding protein